MKAARGNGPDRHQAPMSSPPLARRGPAWLWQQMTAEARELAQQEPILATLHYAAILNHGNLAAALGHFLAERLGSRDVSTTLMRQVCDQAYAADPALIEAAGADILAHYDRDPACEAYSTPLLYYKGFHAIQAYRVSHWLWHNGRQGLACYWQNRISTVFDVDIHPAARLGRGIMVDHATALVIGETTVIADNVSLLHSVTLGGCGRSSQARRHPRIAEGVLISAGAKLLGPIEVGAAARVAAGSVVLSDVPAHSTVAGVPARVVARSAEASDAPALKMDQELPD